MDTGLSPPRSCARGKRKKVAQASKQKRPKVCSTDPALHHCDIRGKGFKRLSRFREHLRIHTGERPHQYKRCAKTFARCADFTKHCLVRLAPHPHHCGACRKRFELASSAEAPFTCHLCPRSFQRPTCLVMHLRVHAQEEPFACAPALALQVGGLGHGARGPPPLQPMPQGPHAPLLLRAAPAPLAARACPLPSNHRSSLRRPPWALHPAGSSERRAGRTQQASAGSPASP
ncbi:zinc finger protein 358-like [Varanus komodoensis]|uniref:zinc finger protein 358-like n=1 Tax=Varanus komodoensis TaxID=61221 RepID=UPI001CF7795D|nr:zinc finger protein 358-like [Varanus komodoensis]